MYIHLTDEALEAISERIGTGSTTCYLKLVYDTEGCGCNGLPALHLVSAIEDTDILVDSNGPPMATDKARFIFFEERMKIDLSGSTSFKLSSDSQIYSSNVRLVDRRS